MAERIPGGGRAITDEEAMAARDVPEPACGRIIGWMPDGLPVGCTRPQHGDARHSASVAWFE